jgi:hypothetical protein
MISKPSLKVETPPSKMTATLECISPEEVYNFRGMAWIQDLENPEKSKYCIFMGTNAITSSAYGKSYLAWKLSDPKGD